MATVQTRLRKDGTTAHRVLFRHEGKQKTETFETAQGAANFADVIRRVGADQAVAQLNARGRTTIQSAPVLVDYMRQRVLDLPGITEGTRSDYLAYINRDVDMTTIGQTPIDLVTRQQVGAWVTYLHRERKLSGKSIGNRHALVSSTFNQAVLDRIRVDNPCAGIRLPKTQHLVEKVYLSGSEFAVLLDHIPHYWRPLVTFLFSTGTRWGEATALKIKDVDLASSQPQFAVVASWKHTDGKGHDIGPPKTQKGYRSIGLTPPMVNLLRPLIEDRKRDDYVFTNRQGRPVLHNSFYSRVWAPAVAAAEPIIHKHPRIHDCRHSAASNMIQQGVPLNVVQQMLGHESIRTTVDVYGHTAANALSIAAQAAAMSLVEAYPELEQ